ncbi:MAG: RnfH family protein [Gammaproteobacteria bacterium]
MNVGVCYAEADRQTWLRLEVPDDSTVQQAIELSGVLRQYPYIDLSSQKVGIFGKITKLDAPIKEGDRIEIYRQITADPQTVQRRRIDTD